MTRTTRRAMLSGAATLALPAIARAQSVTEISFYFPVAVGGPITKIIDGYAADFQRDVDREELLVGGEEVKKIPSVQINCWSSAIDMAPVFFDDDFPRHGRKFCGRINHDSHGKVGPKGKELVG